MDWELQKIGDVPMDWELQKLGDVPTDWELQEMYRQFGNSEEINISWTLDEPMEFHYCTRRKT